MELRVPHPILRVLSFDSVLPLSGITSWNWRTAVTMARARELGIHWQAVEVGERGEFEQVLENVPLECRDRLTFVERGRQESSWAILERAVRQHPEWSEADVVVPNGPVCGWAFPERLFRREGRRPAVIGSIHNDKEVDYKMNGEGASGLDGIFAVSRRCQAEFIRRYPHLPRPVFVPYGVPTADTMSARSTEGPLRVAYCGRVVHEQKRSLDLVPLIHELLAKKVDFEFHVIGAGPALPELQERLAAEAGQCVVFHGAVQTARVPALMSQMHLIVSLSEYEGTSISMLEAMGQGAVPVVTDIASGVRDAIEPGASGWLIPLGDIPAMAALIAELAGDRDRLLGASKLSLERVRRLYSLEASAAAMAGLVRDVARRPRASYRMNRNHPMWRSGRLDLPWLPDALVRSARRVKEAISRL